MSSSLSNFKKKILKSQKTKRNKRETPWKSQKVDGVMINDSWPRAKTVDSVKVSHGWIYLTLVLRD